MTCTAVERAEARLRRRAQFRPALLATITRDADTNTFRDTTYAWVDEAHPHTPVEPASFFTAEFGDLDDPDDILYVFGATLQIQCPVIVRQEWI